MIRVGIVGATGYTGLELIKLLLRHPDVQITALSSRREARTPIAEVHPQLAGRTEVHLENLSAQAVAERCDCAFSCLPHGASAETVSQLLAAGIRVIDFSADYRLNDVAVYEQWYATTHPDPGRIGSVPYGLPELFGKQIAKADLVANPGCYPTGSVLALSPLLRNKAIMPEDLIIDAKSGVSGAGRTPKLATLFPECNESLAAYNVGVHRHTPEIRQLLSAMAENDVAPVFTPHLAPMDRGILTTAYARPTANQSENELLDILHDAYANCPFVRVSSRLPATKHTAYTNFCDISLRAVEGRVIVISAIDNLIKGASGAAVQNMNWMFGFDETAGLL